MPPPAAFSHRTDARRNEAGFRVEGQHVGNDLRIFGGGFHESVEQAGRGGRQVLRLLLSAALPVQHIRGPVDLRVPLVAVLGPGPLIFLYFRCNRVPVAAHSAHVVSPPSRCGR